jgi:hypothetical protein
MSEAVERAVQSKYGAVATSGLSSDLAGVRAVAEAFDYTAEELASIPTRTATAATSGRKDAVEDIGRVSLCPS